MIRYASLAVVLVAVCSVFGGEVCVYGNAGGAVNLPGLDARLHPCAYNRDWICGRTGGDFFPAKDGLMHWTIAPDGAGRPKIVGTQKAERISDRAARLTWTFTPEADMELNDVGVSGDFRYADLRGGTVLLDAKKVKLPEETPERPQLAHASAANVKVLDAAGTVRAEFVFDAPRGVLVQDNRAWNMPGFSLRFALPREKPFAKGRTISLSLVYASVAPFRTGRPDPVKIKPGPNWLPLAPAGDIVEGSALDFSRMRGTEAPAGKYGRVRARGAAFEFEGRPGVPQRFYGVNVCFTANLPPTREAARAFAARLRKTGYNAIRFHHHESKLVEGMKDPSATTLNPENLRRFDALVAACIENGIYLTTDLYVSRRPIAWRAIGVDRAGELSMKDAKAWLLVHGGMQTNLFAFVRNLFGHVNEYTGRSLAEEPALMGVSLVNEASQGSDPAYLAKQEPWVAAWRTWLAAQKTRDPAFYGEIGEAFPSGVDTKSGRAAQACLLFLQETESAFAAKLTRFLRDEMKCRAPLTNLNGCWFPVAYQRCKEVDYDYVDDHFYVDHPHFLEQPWRLPSSCPNVNPLANDALGVQGIAVRRVLNRPFTCTEYNYSGPGRFRGVGGIATGALAALQGWSGLWRFAWSHCVEGVVAPETRALGYFDMSGDPLGLASERASICLFLRRDLSELGKTYAVHLPEEVVHAPNPQLGVGTWTSFLWAGWYAKLGTQLGACAPTGTVSAGTFPEVRTKPRADVFRDLGLRVPEDGEFPRAGGGAIHVDRDTGAFTIITPRTCGGFAEEGTIRAQALTAELAGAPATVWASSLDGWPIGVSSRILVTHLTDVQNTDIAYADDTLRVLLAWGHLPHLMRNGSAVCRLRLADGSWTVHALAPDGSRRQVVPSAFARGRLDFTARVDLDPFAATYLYELVRE